MGHTSGFITDNSLSDIIANARKKYGRRDRVHQKIYKELLYGYSTSVYSNCQQLRENLTLQKKSGHALFAFENGQ
jgi:hypothetical protein